jgi:hypothetical protein
MSWRMYMKTKLAALTLLAIALLVSGVSAAGGNGIDLKGQHFTLNLIGMEKGKTMPEDLSGHAMFVKYSRTGSLTTKILLSEGDFAVLDKDGTDGIAKFQLPYPYELFTEGVIPEDAETCYKVFARALGKPGGSADMYACAEDADGEYCYTGDIITIERPSDKNGPSKFVDITRQLTTITYMGDDYAIFANASYDYFWKYENDGLKHAQLRFYPTAECADSPYF